MLIVVRIGVTDPVKGPIDRSAHSQHEQRQDNRQYR